MPNPDNVVLCGIWKNISPTLPSSDPQTTDTAFAIFDYLVSTPHFQTISSLVVAVSDVGCGGWSWCGFRISKHKYLYLHILSILARASPSQPILVTSRILDQGWAGLLKLQTMVCEDFTTKTFSCLLVESSD